MLGYIGFHLVLHESLVDRITVVIQLILPCEILLARLTFLTYDPREGI